MPRKLVAKENHDIEIIGTLETLSGVAIINADLEYEGGTTIWWDEQKTVMRDGQRVFVDEDGYEYLESEIEVIEC